MQVSIGALNGSIGRRSVTRPNFQQNGTTINPFGINALSGKKVAFTNSSSVKLFVCPVLQPPQT
jgi:hypothetical protein